jgi:hypothetical protein
MSGAADGAKCGAKNQIIKGGALPLIDPARARGVNRNTCPKVPHVLRRTGLG